MVGSQSARRSRLTLPVMLVPNPHIQRVHDKGKGKARQSETQLRAGPR